MTGVRIKSQVRVPENMRGFLKAPNYFYPSILALNMKYLLGFHKYNLGITYPPPITVILIKCDYLVLLSFLKGDMIDFQLNYMIYVLILADSISPVLST